MVAVTPFLPDRPDRPDLPRLPGRGAADGLPPRHIGPHPRHAPGVWQEWLSGRAVPSVAAADIVPASGRLVVVAPHPDDELLACGLLLQAHLQQGGRVHIVGVTDGEASHAGDPGWPASALAATRRAERRSGMRALGLHTAPLLRLGLPDGGVAAHEAALARTLREMLRADDVVVSTWRLDGHPDHEACGRAAADAARAAGATLWEAPVWMWHWADPSNGEIPWHRLRTLRAGAGAPRGQAAARKATALACHLSQLAPRAGGEGPVLDDAIRQRARWPFETFLAPA
ncbi:PIG-L deacetylase family protein [Acidovorax sp. Leaf160]|uniref:PIG-L deacetylase family protein n=1 Tax=Acidovorax sp. Leaf160 TaxID=1736280 RepID=UPI001F3C571A|nr:PIG-L family deacetylase [Acidovorax sp. Leaf160]